jgi:hypothetical protein
MPVAQLAIDLPALSTCLVLLLLLHANHHQQISALRFLSAQAGAQCRFLVLTTKIINGRTLLDTFLDNPARCIRKA